MSEEIKTCENCRYGIYSNYSAGGDCSNCDEETKSGWMAFKRYDPKLCAKCLYHDDPCHYNCVECQEGKNYEPKPTLKQELLDKINCRKREIIALEMELKELEEK